MESSPPPIESNTAVPLRPTGITVICFIGFIGVLLAVPRIFTDTGGNSGTWQHYHLAFSTLVGAVCMVGLWRMQRWAVFTYTGMAALNQVVMLVTGVWNIVALLIPGIIVAVLFKHLSKMR